jgi:hypothetical protein
MVNSEEIGPRRSLSNIGSLLLSGQLLSAPFTTKLILRPVINFGANFVFKQAVRIKLVQGWEDPIAGGYSSLPGPGGARAEAERRRSADISYAVGYS